MFVDQIRVYCQAGDGGDGAVSFRKEKYVPKGGPDGGDGGDGGAVILKVDENTDSLREYHFDPKIIAGHGVPGSKWKRHGKRGKTKIAKVPPGTVVYQTPALTMAEALEMERSEEGIDLNPVVDLTTHGDEFLLCHPGKGGRGNFHFRSSTNQTPTEREEGTEGEKGVFYFELRRIADAAFVGFPNAGKSTLLTKLSNATPKIGSYPFTTLTPQIGVLEFGEGERATLADIPGLIEGAHANRGLGHEFLRHLSRCRLLMFTVDMAGTDGRDPISDIQTLRTELKLYDEELSRFEWLIIANKMDEEGTAESLEHLKGRFPKVEIIPVSAQEGEGLDHLRARLQQRLQRLEEKQEA